MRFLLFTLLLFARVAAGTPVTLTGVTLTGVTLTGVTLTGVTLTGQLLHVSAPTLECTVLPADLREQPRTVSIPLHSGTFTHQIPVSGHVFLSFFDGVNRFAGFAGPGTRLHIRYDGQAFGSTFTAEGPGKMAFLLPGKIFQLQTAAGKYVLEAKTRPFPVDDLFARIDSTAAGIRKQIADPSLSAESRAQLLGYLEAMILRVKYNGVVSVFGDSFESIRKKEAARLSTASLTKMRELFLFRKDLASSRFYVSMTESVLGMYYEENVAPTDTSASSLYGYYARQLSEPLRSRVLFSRLSKDVGSNRVPDSTVARGIALVRDKDLKQLLTDRQTYAARISPGKSAPDFQLEDVQGKKISLASLKGKVVHLDFWFAACGPCHALFNAIAPVKKAYEKNPDVVFLVVSVDGKDTWQKALARFQIHGYHAYTEDQFRDHPMIRSYLISAYPTTFLLDRHGRFSSVTPARNAEALTQQIEVALAGH